MSRRLLELARQVDVTAFEDLIKQHERFVFGIAWRVLGNVQDAQDAAQEVFLRLHRYLNSLDEERKIAPWLYQLTINVCRDIRRRARRRCVVPLEELWSETGFEGAVTTADPEVILTESEKRRILEQGLLRLAEREREAIVLRDVQGLPTAEVAGAMGFTENTVRSQISSGRLKLRAFAAQFLRRRP